MILNKIEIKNFRSIKDQTINFKRDFQTLVGINESGKSNLIKAASFLDKGKLFSKNDIRDPGHDEGEIEEAYIHFIFNIENKVNEEIFESLKNTFPAQSIDKKILKLGMKSINLQEFCESKNEVIYRINLITEVREIAYWGLEKSCSVLKDWMKVKEGALFEFTDKGTAVNLSEYSYINIIDNSDIPEELLELPTLLEINALIGNKIIENYTGKIPSAILWEYSEDNLLPGQIQYSLFVSSPETCIPLRNMFSLSGFSDITKTLQEAEGKSNGVRNILRKVSVITTKHMQEVWPEWENQKVTLYQNGDIIEAGIEDEYNIYSLSRRSDGFKRFFTFLLMISAQRKTAGNSNNIILIDEPDIGLHPSGVSYLRDELKKISKVNPVLVSTHSIFMIDKEIIDRHLLVKKVNEITTFEEAGPSNMLDEEVIYKALGYSLYELLKPKNIIFEGWKDKKMFEMFLRSNTGKDIFSSEEIREIGFLHSMGVKDIGRVANTCENFGREYIIITDSDKPAKEKKKLFEGKAEWILYNEINDLDAITTEDFVSNTLINIAIKFGLNHHGENVTLELGDDITKDKVVRIQKGLIDAGTEKQKAIEIVRTIKDRISEQTKGPDLNEKYKEMCEFIKIKIYPIKEE